MSLAIFSALILAPAPVDERAQILDAVKGALAAFASGKQADMRRALDVDGTLFRLDLTNGPLEVQVKRNGEMVAGPDRSTTFTYAESIANPMVLQRGPLAQVWAPYLVTINGTKHHCGIDSITVIKRDGKWAVTNLSYTVEPTSTCADLGAPETTQ